MEQIAPKFQVKLAETDDEIRAAQALRYRVFVQELGADGPMVDHDAGLEVDQFDAHYDHLLLIDEQQDRAVVGVYRLLRDEQAAKLGRYYSEDEYDLSVLKSSGRRLMELGRSCLDAEYRGGAGMFHLWAALADYVTAHEVDILFGVASFHGTDPEALKQPLSLLHHRHLAPPELRVRAREKHFVPLDMLPPNELDRKAAMLQVPALIKSYLRLGGFVGDGAYIDQGFNTTDVCLILDAQRISNTKKSIFNRSI